MINTGELKDWFHHIKLYEFIKESNIPSKSGYDCIYIYTLPYLTLPYLTFPNFCFAYFNNYINLSKLCNFVAFSEAETFH